MVDSHQTLDWLFQPDDSNGQVSDGDLELAYRLQHSQPGDENIQLLLVRRFAAEIHRLVVGWLVFDRRVNASSAIIRVLVVDILAGAALQVEGFRGEASVRNWIYRLAIKHLGKLYRWKFIRRTGIALAEATALTPIWRLSRAQRSLLWLRYGMQLDLPDCAFILDLPLPKIQRQLHLARSRLVFVEKTAELAPECDACWQAIWDRSDGLLKGDVQAVAHLESHLLDCAPCQELAGKAAEFEQSLTAVMTSNWPPPVFNEDDIHRITADIPAYKRKNYFPLVAPRWIKAGWTGLIILAFVAAGIYWMGKMRQESDQALIATPEAERLPALIQSVPATELAIKDQADVLEVQYIAQDQSDGGNWVVYTIYEVQSGNPDYTYHLLVYLYDTTTKISQNLFESAQFTQPNVQMWLDAPVISADGDRLVFSAPHNTEDDEACLTPEGLPCVDIYIYQQSSAELTRITHSWEGGPSDGDSYSPAISTDGQVITFWSTAQNLVADPDEECAWGEHSTACLQAYIYSVASGEIDSLGLTYVQGDSGVDRMSLSADGSVVALTTVVMAWGDTLSHNYTYLYDRNSGVIEDLDHAVDGTPGNGSVYGAVVDASGRYIAFVSDSSNLVPDDTNGFTDVFWYDRQTGELVRVNLGPGGEQADNHSGILAPGVAFNSLDMSADGQQLIYLSLASNLVENPGNCAQANEEMCNALYYYNHQTGQTELIAARRNNGFNLFPTINGSGRWVAYSGLREDCQPLYYCSDIYYLDRQNGWTDNLTGFASDFPGYAWLVGDSMSLQGTHTNDLAFSPNGEYLAAANSDGRVRVFQISDASLYTAFQKDASSPVVHLDISPDNRLLAGGTASGEVKVWDVQQKRLLYVLDDLPGKVIDLFFSPDSSLITIITPELASIWQFGDQVITRVQNIPLGGPRVQDTDLSPVGNLLATARQDGTVWLQLLPNGVVLARLAGGEQAMYDITFSSDGSRLASRSLDGTVNVWQIDWSGFGALEATPLASYHTSDWIGNLAFVADGASLASIRNTGGVDIWDLNDGRTYQMVTPRVDRLAFAPQGDTLATATFGSLDLWSGPGLTSGQYFTHVESDTLVNEALLPISAANDLGLTQWLAVQNRSRSLYELDDIWPADLAAPARLPEGIIFQGAYLSEDEIVLLHYHLGSRYGSPAGLYILEQPASDDSQAMPVGESAQVHQRAVGDILFEFVRGDWLPDASAGADSPTIHWKWDNSANSNRLRWQQGDLLIAIYYPATNNNSASFSMEDLLQMAAGFELVNQSPLEEIEFVEYIVQPGDTCTWIANRFWVEMEDIIQANNLGGSCDTIFAGEELLIPITHKSYRLTDADLDCNGSSERIELILGTGLWTGVRVLARGDNGFYIPAWEWILGDFAPERFNRVRLVNNGGCTNLLVVEVVWSSQSHWSLFTWDGTTMQPFEMDPLQLDELLHVNEITP
jgi:WD40 repeat protein